MYKACNVCTVYRSDYSIYVIFFYFFLFFGAFFRYFHFNWLTINRRYNNRISSSGGIDSTLHVKLYTSSEPLNVGEMNSAGPGRPDISMYFFVRPNALSATQLFTHTKTQRSHPIHPIQSNPTTDDSDKVKSINVVSQWFEAPHESAKIQWEKIEGKRKYSNYTDYSIFQLHDFSKCEQRWWCWRL